MVNEKRKIYCEFKHWENIDLVQRVKKRKKNNSGFPQKEEISL